MRNLKRVLSLALALVMVLGMMVITTSAADFTDAEEITQTEAVEVLAKLGIVQGTNGAFNPNGTFTREAAAKLITYMKLGPDMAEKLAGTDVFTDVAASRWSAKYIGYCANLGYITGVGDGKFNPSGILTDIELGKLVLCALGKDPAKYTGANWASAVTVDMIDAELVDAVTGTTISREDACAMILNGLNYSATSKQYWTVTVSPTEIYKFDTQNDAILYKSVLGTGTIDGPLTDKADTLMKDVYEVTVNNNGSDAYGRPATTYNHDKWDAPMVYTQAPVLTSTTTIKAADLYNALGYKAVIDASGCSYVHANGVGTGAYWIANGTGARADYAVANKNVNIGANGILTEIYKADNRATTATVEYIMVQTRASLAQVGIPTKIDASATEGAKITYTLTPDSVGSVITLEDYTSVIDTANDKDNFVSDVELAKDAYVWVYSDANGFYTVKAADSATLTATWQDATSFVADGMTYKYNVNNNGTIASSDVTDKVAKVVYFDEYGYVAKVANPAGGLPNYAYVLDIDSDTVMFEGTTYYAKLLYTDGTVETVKIPDADNGLKDNLVSYAPGTGRDTGKIDLTRVSAAGGATRIDKNDATVFGTAVNNKTVFVVETTVNGKSVYTSYTGVTNVPALTATTTAGKAANGAWTVFYAMGATLTGTGTTAKDVVYVNNASCSTATDVNKGTYYTYNAIVNGEITKVESTVNTLGGFYTALISNDKGLVTGGVTMTTAAPIATVAETGTAVAKDGIIVLGSTNYVYTDDTVVYTVNPVTKMISASTIGAIKADLNDAVVGYTTNNILSMIVIEVAP